jgi:hypothetical protein
LRLIGDTAPPNPRRKRITGELAERKDENMELEQLTIFGEDVISSIGYNEQDIIRNILHLHANGKMIDCDPTYSIGNFYKGWAVKPKYKFDKFPQLEGVVEATSDKLPLENNSVEVIMFDPPFVISGEDYDDLPEGSGIISKRFTAFKNFIQLKEMYQKSLVEFYRILTEGGILIFKCQDIVSSALNHFSHCWVMNEALKVGFYPKDLFILIAKNRINDGRKQQHARKYHCYFWVFKKTKCKILY